MRAIACGTTLAKRASWRRWSSVALRNRWKAWTPARPVSSSTVSNVAAAPRSWGWIVYPTCRWAQEEATGILSLMRVSKDKALGILEQARFLADLLSIHGMSVAEVAQMLSRSKGWISMRRRLLEEMGLPIREILFRGAFPVYSYMYTLRPFMRMNSVTQEQIERFVKAVAGKRLSVREIELLAHAYFRGTRFPAGSDRGRQAGLVARPTQERAGGPGRLQCVRARVARRPRGLAEINAAGDGEMLRPAFGGPGLLRPGQSVERWFTQYVGTFLGRDERVL